MGARERQYEGRPHANLAVHADLAMHGASQIAADGKAETRPFVPACAARLKLDERLEDPLYLVRRDACARVHDAQPNGRRVDQRIDRDRPATVRELDRVRQQVEQDLTNLLWVRVNGQLRRTWHVDVG